MNTLVMKFKNKAGKSATIRVAKVKDGLTLTEADSLMDLIISRNIFFTGDEELSEKVSAELDSSVVLS